MPDGPPLPWTRRQYLAGAAAAALTPWGALAQTSQKPQRPPNPSPRDSHITLSLSLEPVSLDLGMTAAASAGEVAHYNILEGLTKVQENASVSPLLAQEWQRSNDGRSYRFQLRQGVRFQDGQAFDSAAVRFSFARAVAPGATNKSRKALFDNISSLQTPDAHSVVLELHHADPHLLFRLGESPAVITHPASAGQLADNPIGTGPYRLSQWRRGHSLQLQAAPSYRAAEQLRMRSASYLFTPEAQAQIQALQAGEVDVFFQLATGAIRTMQNDNRYHLLTGSSSGKGLLALNHRHAALGDVRVRRAISHAIDRQAFIRNVLDGRGHAIGSHFAPTDPGFLHLESIYPHDPARAQALLRETGLKLPLELTLTVPPAPYAQVGAPLLAEQLAQVGIQLRLHQVSWADWLKNAFTGQFETTLINHVEPLDYLIYTDPKYYFGYDSATFRDLAQRHATASLAREQQRLWGQIQRHLAQDAVNAWIFTPQIATVVRRGLRGKWMNYPIFAHDIAALWWD